MRFYLSSAAWLCTIGLLTTAIPVLAMPEGAIVQGAGQAIGVTIAQAQASDPLQKSIDEGTRLLREGSKASLTAAIPQFEQALKLSQAENQKAQRALASLRLGLVYFRLSQNSKALEFYNQALPLYRALGDRNSEAITIGNIGGAYSRLNQNPKALEFYHQALPIFRALDNRASEATTLYSIGLVYSKLNQNPKALEFYNQALPLHRAMDDRDGEATTLNGIGLVYSTLNQKPKALEFYNQALPLRRAVGDRDGEATTLNNIGGVYYELGQNLKALEFYNLALPIFREVGDRGGEAGTLNNIGLVYSDLGEKPKALEFYNQALPLIREVGDQHFEGRTLNNIGLLLEGQKQPELAIVFYKQSVNAYETVRDLNRTLPRELRESQTKTFSRTYQDLSDLLIKQGRLPEAQAVLELLQLKELREYTRDASPNNQGISLAPAEQAVFDSILKQYGTVNQFATKVAECELAKCPDLIKLQAQRDQTATITNNILDRLRSTLTTQALDLSQLKTEEFTKKASEIVNAQPGTILIYPIVQDHNIIFLIAVKAGAGEKAAVTYRAINGPTIESDKVFTAASNLRKQLSTPHSDLKELQTNSQELYQWLIKPLEPEINQSNVKHLVFASTKATRYIPFAALHDGKEYLINKPYTLSIVLAASITDPIAPRPTNPTLLAAGAGIFPERTSLEPLPFVNREINAIVRTPQSPQGIFPGNQIFNDKFDFPSLKAQLQDNQFNFLHIATHGALDPGNTDNSYLVPGKGQPIAKDQIRTLGDYGLKNVNLVVLSACNTAVGTSANSANGLNADRLELSGISYYFMANGAKSVMASLWSVNDDSTALSMQQFYTHLAQGMTKAQAIQAVQQDFISGKLTPTDASKVGRGNAIATIFPKGISPANAPPPNYTHPFYWAPFILIGNSQ